MKNKVLLFAVSLSLGMVLGVVSQVNAQDGSSPALSSEGETNEERVQQTFAATKPVFNPAEYKSILYTSWEQDAIALARRAANNPNSESRGATQFEIDKSQIRNDLTQKIKPPPEEREIRLAGIMYDTGDRWTIWLNEERVTPDAVPPEVIDLKVHKEYIEFKWIDDYTNRIYPIRLRPHQRFNIDTRIFLPG